MVQGLLPCIVRTPTNPPLKLPGLGRGRFITAPSRGYVEGMQPRPWTPSRLALPPWDGYGPYKSLEGWFLLSFPSSRIHAPETQTLLEGTESNGRSPMGEVPWPPDFENQLATCSIQNLPNRYPLCAQHCGRGPGCYPLSVWLVTGIIIVNDDNTPSGRCQGLVLTSFKTLQPCRMDVILFISQLRVLILENLTDL